MYNLQGAKLDALADGETVTEVGRVYVLDDSSGSFSTSTAGYQDITFTLVGANDAPIANDDTDSTDEDTAITLDVLANDTDVDNGDSPSITGLSGSTSAQGAAISINGSGQIVYDPSGSAALQALNNGQTAVDTFSYTVQDGSGATDVATVSITVGGVTDGPRAVNDSASTSEDNRIFIDVLANDVSPAGGKTIIGITDANSSVAGFQSAYGAQLEIAADGKIFYNPQNAALLQALNSGESVVDTFSYHMRDASGAISTATVSVTVSGFTDGTVIDSGVTGTMTFNTSASSSRQSYTEAGITVQSLYPPSSGPHLHMDSSDLMNHNGCCSEPYEFRYYNPSNTDTTFSLQSFQNLVGSGTWTSSKLGSVFVSAGGTADFSSNPLFQDIGWLQWETASNLTGTYTGGNQIDNLVFTA